MKKFLKGLGNFLLNVGAGLVLPIVLLVGLTAFIIRALIKGDIGGGNPPSNWPYWG